MPETKCVPALLREVAVGYLWETGSTIPKSRSQRTVKVGTGSKPEIPWSKTKIGLDGGNPITEAIATRRAETTRDDVELLGLDHRAMQEELGRWRSLPPEEIGIAVHDGADAPILLSIWLVESSTGGGERRVGVQTIAVKPDGTRVPAAERQTDHYLAAPPASPIFSPSQRGKFFENAVEPTLQRELKHKGAANGDGSYSSTLIGYVEIQ